MTRLFQKQIASRLLFKREHLVAALNIARGTFFERFTENIYQCVCVCVRVHEKASTKLTRIRMLFRANSVYKIKKKIKKKTNVTTISIMHTYTSRVTSSAVRFTEYSSKRHRVTEGKKKLRKKIHNPYLLLITRVPFDELSSPGKMRNLVAGKRFKDDVAVWHILIR